MQSFFWNDFPSTHGMIFDKVIQNCWRKRYNSVVELEYSTIADLGTSLKIAPVIDNHELKLRLKECQEFLQKNADIVYGYEIQPAERDPA